MTYPLPPDLEARFAHVMRLPSYVDALNHQPKRMTWVNLAIVVVILGAALFGVWYAGLASRDFADRRGDGVKMGVLVTLVLGFAGWYSFRDWKRRAYGAVHPVLVIVHDKSQTRIPFSRIRYRWSSVSVIHHNGGFEKVSVEPYLYARIPVGALGVLYYRDTTPVEFIPLAV